MIIVIACVALLVWLAAYKALESRGPRPLFVMLTLPVLAALAVMSLLDVAISQRSLEQEARLYLTIAPLIVAFCGLVWIRMTVTKRLTARKR